MRQSINPMKAIVMTQPGNPEVLQLQDVEQPKLTGDRDLLVQLYAAGVNPIDTKLRQRGTFYPDQMPAILGCDGAGIVEAVAPGVQNFQPGDAVYFCYGGMGGTQGNYAEWVTIDERFVAHKPKSLSFIEAAAAPLVLITAWESLYDRAQLQPHQTVLIQAGAGGVGHVAIQLAKLQEAKVCTTVSTPEKAEFVQQLGADLAIFYRDQNVVEMVKQWTNQAGVDIGFDTVGGEVFFQTCEAVKIYGDVVTILEPNLQAGTLKTARSRNQRISLELMLTPMLEKMLAAQQDQARILQRCAKLLDEQRLKIQVADVLPLTAASEAHQRLEMGGLQGKLVLQIRDASS